ncbi:MAG: hypothetical protein QOD98_2650 [Nocardioidaceae bacterium]|nr:hypothetical protein [Nocardioidaceae bacterium]
MYVDPFGAIALEAREELRSADKVCCGRCASMTSAGRGRLLGARLRTKSGPEAQTASSLLPDLETYKSLTCGNSE